jgi:uncharacterized pyridoxal phosphate-containing UPF0001 family protein
MDELAGLAVRWHFIGGIQSNKTRAIAERFDWVHSIDRLSVAGACRISGLSRAAAQRLHPGRPGAGAHQGRRRPGRLAELAAQIAELPRIKLRGLMCVPPPQPTCRPSARYSRGSCGLCSRS